MGKKIVKDTLALVLIVLVSAVCLSLVYETTKDRIALAEAEERLASFRGVFPEASGFTDFELDPERAVSSDGVAVTDALYAVNDDGEAVGCVLSVTNPNGYGGDIVISVGFDTEGKITGMTVTAMSETAGLGAKCQDEAWQEQFRGIADFPVAFVKSGRSAWNEIDALSGATVTTRAVTGSVNFAAAFVAAEFGYGGES